MKTLTTRFNKSILSFGMYLVMLFGIISCSSTPPEMDQWESKLSQQLQAEYVKIIKHTSYEAKIGEGSSKKESLKINVYNANALNEMPYNEQFTNKCREIKDSVVVAYGIEQGSFDEIEVNVVKRSGSMLFHKDNAKSVSFTKSE